MPKQTLLPATETILLHVKDRYCGNKLTILSLLLENCRAIVEALEFGLDL